MAVKFETIGLSVARERLVEVMQRGRNPRPAFVDVGEELMAVNQQRVASGVDVEGRPIAPSWRARHEGGQTLINSGEYLSSWNYAANEGGLDYFSSDKRARVLRGDIPEIRPVHAQFLALPMRAAGGMFAGLVNLDVKKNRSGALPAHYDRDSTFVKRRGSSSFVVQSVGASKALRVLFGLYKSLPTKRRDVPGIGSADVEMAAQKVGDYVAEGKRS